MGMTFDQLTPVGDTGVKDEDIFAIWQSETGTNKSVAASVLRAYIASKSNGLFRGSTTKGLDEFEASDTGVWKWTGEATEAFPFEYAIVEIIRHEEQAGTDNAYDYIQRLNVGSYVYQRMKPSTSEGWTPLKRLDPDYQIQFGSGTFDASSASGYTEITFETPFNRTPTVIVMPINTRSEISMTATVGVVTPTSFFTRLFVQEMPASGVSCPVVDLISDGGGNYAMINNSDLADYIDRYCIPRVENCAFYWIAIAPKTVNPS